MSHVQDAVRIGPSELVEIEGPPEIHRRQAFAKPGLWAGLTTTEPGLVSGWHHHGGHDTIVYVISRSVAIEFGEAVGHSPQHYPDQNDGVCHQGQSDPSDQLIWLSSERTS